jgi:Predicted redox protein, regulator of disulfide bond formation
MNDEINFVDASGLKCPLPVLKARKALEGLAHGDKLRVLSTDPASPLDFKHFCNSKGHSLLSIEEKQEKLNLL